MHYKRSFVFQAKGVTRLFGDYSFADNGVDIESIGNNYHYQTSN